MSRRLPPPVSRCRARACRWARRAPVLAGASAGLLLAVPVAGHPTTSGESPPTDGAHGRFQGDLELGVGLGTELGATAPAPLARGSLHYFSMAGLAVSYANSLRTGSDRSETLSLLVDLRPLFIPRWSNDLERGPARLDLWLDSWSIGAGAFWSQAPGEIFGTRRGFEGSIGCALPLVPRASGPWLQARATLRWPRATTGTSPAADVFGQLVLEWHSFVETFLVR